MAGGWVACRGLCHWPTRPFKQLNLVCTFGYVSRDRKNRILLDDGFRRPLQRDVMPSRMSVSVAKMHDRFSRQQIRHDEHRGVFVVGVNEIQEWLADELFYRIA